MGELLSQVAFSTSATVEQQWSATFFGLDQEQRFTLLLVGIGCLTGIILGLTAIALGTLSTMHRRRLEAEMKREMLDRGMSSEEIKSIVAASPPRHWLERAVAAQRKS